jgi:peptidoglycan/LPS O-acetylase OafA/YrhL
MGSLRFLLACLVLLSHLGISIGGLNPGVSAVVVFYLLAGHVAARLWLKWTSGGIRAKIYGFYLNSHIIN